MHPQMELSKLLEEINILNHPFESGIVLNEDRNQKFFERNHFPIHLQSDSTRNVRKLNVFPGLLQKNSFIVITLKPGSWEYFLFLIFCGIGISSGDGICSRSRAAETSA